MYFVDMFSLDEYMQNRYMIWSRRMDCSEGIDEEGLALRGGHGGQKAVDVVLGVHVCLLVLPKTQRPLCTPFTFILH